MNLAHLHIVLNHIPSLGMALGVVLYIWSLYKKNDQLKKVSLPVMVVVALLALPTYLSGNAETCNIATAQAGTYHVRVKAFSAYSGVSLTGSFSGLYLGIRDGHIVDGRSGKAWASAQLSYADIPLHKEGKTKKFTLPGRFKFDAPGIQIPKLV